MVLKTKPFYADNAYEGASYNERAREGDAGPDDSDKSADGEILRYALRLGLRGQVGTGHSKLIRFDSIVSVVQGLWDESIWRKNDQMSCDACVYGLSRSLMGEDGC